MKNSRIKAPLWQKVTSSIVTGVLLSQISLPVVAAVKFSLTMEQLNQAVLSSARYYELKNGTNSFLYAGRLESEELGVFDGFGHFYQLLSEQHPSLIPGYNSGTNTAPTIDTIATRFGSPYVERGLIRDQITHILNKSWISRDGFSSENAQNKILYENAVSIAAQYGFTLGQNLTSNQIAAINVDVIWPELRTINGSQYLVPFVYLAQSTVNEQRIAESTFVANSAEIDTNTFSINGGNVIFKHDSLLDVENDFINTRGYLEGNKITIRVGRELQNLSGTITGDDVTLIAKHLENNTLITRTDYAHGYSEVFQQVGSITSLGDLNIFTSGDVTSHGGSFSAQGDLKINAGGNIILVPQTAKNERAESGDMWSDGESSLVNLQTNLSAVDTLSLIAGGVVHIEGAILESQGLLEILSGYGITLKSAADLKSFEKKFEASSGGVFGTTETYEESKTEAEIIRTLLKAGQSMVLKTTQGNVLLEAVAIDNKGISKIIAENGSIDFTLAKLIEQYSYSHSSEGALAFRHQGHGYNREIAYYTEFIKDGGIFLDAATGVHIEVATGTKGLDATLTELANNPSLAWMQTIRNDPKYADVDWQEIELILEEWEYDESGLSAAALAILAIAIAVATGGAGLAIAGPAGSGALVTATGSFATALNAGFTALVMQSSAALLANNFDLKDTFDDIATKETVTSVATSMITAGVLESIDSQLFADGSFESYAGFGTEHMFSQTVQQVINSAASAGINALANGQSLDEFQDLFIQSLALNSINRLGKELANKIGEAAAPPDGSAPDINLGTKYIAHAALGCGLGALQTSATGGNSDSNADGCLSGATGGVIGEYVAENYRDNIAAIVQDTEKLTSNILTSFDGKDVSEITEQDLYNEAMRLSQYGVDISRLVAGITVFAMGGNVDVAIDTAGNASENNALLGALGQFLTALTRSIASKESAKLLGVFFTAYEGAQAVQSARGAYLEGAKLYEMYLSGDPVQQDLAIERMRKLAIDLTVDLGTSAASAVLILKVTQSARAAQTFEEIAEVLEFTLKKLDNQPAADVFGQLSRTVEFKAEAWTAYKNYGGVLDQASWSKQYDTDTKYALDNMQLWPSNGLFADTPDMSIYFKHLKQYPNTTITQERFIQQWKNGKTIGEKGSWKNITTRTKNIPNDGRHDWSKVPGSEVVRRDHSEFLKQEVEFPDGSKTTVAEAVEHRKQLTREIEALKGNEDNNDVLLALNYERNQITDSLGEANSLFELKRKYGAENVKQLEHRLPGNGKQGQFDGSYEITHANGSKEIFDVESKSGLGASYGTRQVGESQTGDIIDARQGSEVYKADIKKNLKQKVNSAKESDRYKSDADFAKQVDNLYDTLELEQIYDSKYIGSELKFDSSGNIIKSTLFEFGNK